MGSWYAGICLNHQPALIGEADYRNPDDALTAARRLHTECDLLIGRWSGALVEVGCASDNDHGGSWHPHSHEWIKVGWVRLLLAAAALDSPPAELALALREFRCCWTPARLATLAPHLRQVEEAVQALVELGGADG